MNINTSNMIVVAGGAFNEVYHSIEESKILGFTSNNDDEYNDIVTIDDFIEKARMPREFMGRFSIIHLNSLKDKDYEKILKDSDESPITSAKNRFKIMDNVNLIFTNSFIKNAARLAHNKGVGVRGLSEIVSKSINNPFRYINQNLNKYDKVIIDDNILSNPDKYQLIEKNNIEENGIQKVKK